MGYNFFYNYCISVAPSGVVVNSSNFDYTIGAYMRGAAPYETYCKSAFGDIMQGDTDELTPFVMSINGPLTVNAYQRYWFGFNPAFSLAQTDTSYTVAANYYTNGSKDNSAPVVLKGAAATTVGSTETVDKPESAWASFNGNAYTLDNSKSAMSIVAVLDPAANVITLNYYRTTGGTITPVDPNPATPTPTPTNPSTDIPDPDVPATDIPDGDTPKADASKQVTGDSDMALVSGAIAVLSLCGLVYVTVSGRKKDN